MAIESLIGPGASITIAKIVRIGYHDCMDAVEDTWLTESARSLMESVGDSIDLAELAQEVSLRRREAEQVDADLVRVVIEEMRLRGEAGLYERPRPE